MDFNRNVDKLEDYLGGVSYNQILDVNNTATVATELFTVSAFKSQYAKIDNSDEDTLIESLIIAARRMCENHVGINFIARTVIASINNLNGGTYLPFGPVGAIASVSDIDGNVLQSGNYKITGSQFKQVQWPTEDYLVITYTGGYATCPADLITAVKAQTLYLYENRGDVQVIMNQQTGRVAISPIAQLILNPLIRN